MFLEDKAESVKNTYKRIRLFPEIQDSENGDGKRGSGKLLSRKFKPCVSFNTVPSYLGDSNGDDGLDFPGVQIPAEYTMEEFYDDESGYMSNNAEYFLRNNYLTKRNEFGGSPPPRNLANKAAALSSMFRIAQNGKIVRVDYPTTPTITNDAIIINRAQPGWNTAWLTKKAKIEDRVKNKQTHFKFPDIVFPQKQTSKTRILSNDGYTPISKDERRRERVLREKVGFPNLPRTILCHISGRRHTWVALDWAVRVLAQDTDHIVVVANIPRFSTTSVSRGRYGNRLGAPVGSGLYRSRSAEPLGTPNAKTNDQSEEWSSGYSAQMVTDKLEDILTYIAVIVPKDIRIKVTVEIVVGRTKKIILDAMNVYTPDFCTSTTLRWQRTDNLVLWKAKNLTDVLCTKYPIPVFVIPVKRMYDFEASLQKDFTPSESLSVSPSNIPTQSPTPVSNSGGQTPVSPGIGSDSESISGSESNFSGSNIDAVSTSTASREDLIEATRKHREEMSNGLKELDDKVHATAIRKNIDKLELLTHQSLSFAMHVQNMDQEEREAGFTQLRRVITGETEKNVRNKRSMVDVANFPKSSSNKVSSAKPRASQIKFASNVNSKDGRRALGNSKLKLSSADSSPPQDQIKPRNSYDEPLRRVKSSQSAVRKVRSSSNISRVKSNDSMASSSSSSSSKKKSGFLSLFRHSGSRSRSVSRRNSDASDTDAISINDGDSGKKRRSKLFGFS